MYILVWELFICILVQCGTSDRKASWCLSTFSICFFL